MIFPEDEEFLAHFGVKGMKWGQRKVATAKQNRKLNKASRAKDRRQNMKDAVKNKRDYQKSIDKSRNYIDSGKYTRDAKNARSQYKKDKVAIGSREAKKIYREKRIKLDTEFENAMQLRDGKEATQSLLIGAGMVLAYSLAVGVKEARSLKN